MSTRSLSLYWNALIDKNTLSRYISEHYPRIKKYISDNISRNTCPICHRRFSTKYSLYKHMKRSTVCSRTLYNLLLLMARHIPEESILQVIRIGESP